MANDRVARTARLFGSRSDKRFLREPLCAWRHPDSRSYRGRPWQSLLAVAFGPTPARIALWLAVLGAWSCLGLVEPANGTEADDPAHVTLRMNGEPTPAWIPKPAVEIPTAAATDPASMKRDTEQIVGTGVTFAMVPIPGGRFQMGSPKGQARPRRRRRTGPRSAD